MFSKQKNEQKRRDLYVGFNSQDTEYRERETRTPVNGMHVLPARARTSYLCSGEQGQKHSDSVAKHLNKLFHNQITKRCALDCRVYSFFLTDLSCGPWCPGLCLPVLALQVCTTTPGSDHRNLCPHLCTLSSWQRHGALTQKTQTGHSKNPSGEGARGMCGNMETTYGHEE